MPIRLNGVNNICLVNSWQEEYFLLITEVNCIQITISPKNVLSLCKWDIEELSWKLDSVFSCSITATVSFSWSKVKNS